MMLKTPVLNKSFKYCIECHDVSFAIPSSTKRMTLNIALPHGEFYLIAGASNSCKTLFCDLLKGGAFFYSGKLKVLDKDLASLNLDELLSYRREIGFVYEKPLVLKGLSSFDQVLYTLELQGHSKEVAIKYAMDLLSWLSLNPDHLQGNYLFDLSRKNQVKVELAKAIIKQPKLLILDDPLERLDASDRLDFLLYLKELYKAGMTIILLTRHQSVARPFATSVLRLENETLLFEVPYVAASASN